MAGGWLISRVAFRAAFGIEFDASGLGWFWQYVDPGLLQSDPLGSLYYLHTQPPLFNAWLALALGLAGDDPSGLLEASFRAVGLALHLAMLALLLRLGVRRWLAVTAVVAFACSPASILYESWLFYTHPVAAILVAAAWALHRLASRGARRGDAVLFFSLLATAVLTRSLLHLAWMLAVTAGVILVLRAHARRLIACAALPVLLCVAVYGKNALEFGTFGPSTWMGMNLARLAVEPVPIEARRQLVREGRIGAVSLVRPFSQLLDYPPALRSLSDRRHPVLWQPAKASGVVNYNHVAYIEISRRYRRDALRLIADDPGRYLSSVADAWLLFTLPPSEYWFLQRNRTRIEGWDACWNAAAYGVVSAWSGRGVPVEPDPTDRRYLVHRVGVVFVVAGLLALAHALALGVRALRPPRPDPALGLTLLFMAGTVLWVAVLGNALELRENNRFRYMIEPLLAVLVVLGVSRIVQTVKARKSLKNSGIRIRSA